MLAFCTYCSADKYYSDTAVPAIELYKSTRINKVLEMANQSNATFLILSGKYGIVHANEVISYYDHLLTPSEIENHSDLIASQIKLKNITMIEFYMNSVGRDKNIQIYVDCISKACAKASIMLKINIGDFED